MGLEKLTEKERSFIKMFPRNFKYKTIVLAIFILATIASCVEYYFSKSDSAKDWAMTFFYLTTFVYFWWAESKEWKKIIDKLTK